MAADRRFSGSGVTFERAEMSSRSLAIGPTLPTAARSSSWLTPHLAAQYFAS